MKTKVKTLIALNPKYDKLTFSSEQRFEEWLGRMHTKKIEFVDSGLDMDTLWVDASGEILHANMQQSIWNGKFIDMKSLTVGKPARIFMHKQWREIDVVKNITANKYKSNGN